MRKLSVILLLCAGSLPAWSQGIDDEAADTAVIYQPWESRAQLRAGDEFVQDHARILSAASKAQLERLVQQYAASIQVQLAVITVSSLHGREVGQVGDSIKNALGVGNRHSKAGILYLIAPTEHQQSIRVGRGLEPYLTDLICKRILDQTLPKPSQSIELAITNRAQAIIDHLRPDQAEITAEHEQAVAQAQAVTEADSGAGWDTLFILAGVMLGGLFMMLAQYREIAQRRLGIRGLLQPEEPTTPGSWSLSEGSQRAHTAGGGDLLTSAIIGSMFSDSDNDETKKSSSSSSPTCFDFFDSGSSTSDSSSFGGDSDSGGGGASSDNW